MKPSSRQCMQQWISCGMERTQAHRRPKTSLKSSGLPKDWPSLRKSRNSAGEMFSEVDLRPHGERKYFSSKDAAPGGSANPVNRLHREGLEGFEFAATSPRRNRKLTK